jgi:hypothetical protein
MRYLKKKNNILTDLHLTGFYVKLRGTAVSRRPQQKLMAYRVDGTVQNFFTLDARKESNQNDFMIISFVSTVIVIVSLFFLFSNHLPKMDNSGKVLTCIDPIKEEANCLFAVPKKGRIYGKKDAISHLIIYVQQQQFVFISLLSN